MALLEIPVFCTKGVAYWPSNCAVDGGAGTGRGVAGVVTPAGSGTTGEDTSGLGLLNGKSPYPHSFFKRLLLVGKIIILHVVPVLASKLFSFIEVFIAEFTKHH